MTDKLETVAYECTHTETNGTCIQNGPLSGPWINRSLVLRSQAESLLAERDATIAQQAEEIIGYAIHHEESGPVYLEDMEPKFAAMRCAGVPATEHIPHQRFWARAAKVIDISVHPSLLPCACAV